MSKPSTYNSNILKKMNKNDAKHKLGHKFLGFYVYLQQRDSIRPQGTKCHIFVAGSEQQLSHRHSNAFFFN